MEKLKAGVIGCGVISDIYVKNLTTRYKGLEVVACADHHPEKSKELADRYHITASDPDALLKDTNKVKQWNVQLLVKYR